MTTKFPDIEGFRELNRPSRIEADLYDVEIDGEVPSELHGTYYRVGPDPQYPPRNGHDIFLNGDGAVSMFRFGGGHIDFRMRYVRTEKFRLERKARAALYGFYRNPYTDDPRVCGMDRGTANTNVVWHGGKLLALKEDARPMELDPYTLRTLGPWAFHGALQSLTFTAHPKADPQTGELVFFGYEAKGLTTPDIAFGTIDKEGRITREDWITAPYTSMVHDFAVTERHIVFPVFPTTTDLDRLKAGGPHWAWDPGKPTFIGILPRDGDVRDLRWFVGPACWSYHVINAVTEGEKVIVDLCLSQAQSFPFIPIATGEPFDFRAAAARPTRFVFDLSDPDDKFEQIPLSEGTSEMPRVDDRYEMSAYRYGYLGGVDFTRPPLPEAGPVGGGFTHIERLDTHTGLRERCYFGDGASVQEPQFVPRSPDAPEGDGYLLAVVNRAAEHRSDLVVVDAQRIADGPVATAMLPIRLRPAFHGNWIPGSSLSVSTDTADESWR